jgi:hypothetical protein
MSSLSEQPIPVGGTEKMKEKARANVYAPKGTIDIKGLKDVSVNDKVTIIIKGRLSELRDSANEWSPGKDISLEPTSCEIKGPVKKVSISEAIKGSQRKV